MEGERERERERERGHIEEIDVERKWAGHFINDITREITLSGYNSFFFIFRKQFYIELG